MSQGWGKKGGALLCGYKGAARAAWSLHSLESSSELGAITRPERTARRREQILAQIEPNRGQGGERRVQAPILDLFPSSGTLLGPAAASSAEPPTQCWNKKIAARRRSLFLSDPELRVVALHELSNQSDRHF